MLTSVRRLHHISARLPGEVTLSISYWHSVGVLAPRYGVDIYKCRRKNCGRGVRGAGDGRAGHAAAARSTFPIVSVLFREYVCGEKAHRGV